MWQGVLHSVFDVSVSPDLTNIQVEIHGRGHGGSNSAGVAGPWRTGQGRIHGQMMREVGELVDAIHCM